MKKIVLTSFVAMFAVTTAHAVGTPGTVTNLATGASNTITSQAYVNRNINDQVAAEQTHRKSADGDLQFTGTAQPATDITGAINLISTAVSGVDNKQDKSADVTATSGNIAIWGADGQTVTGKVLQGSVSTIGGITPGQVASTDLVESYTGLVINDSFGNAITQGTKTTDAVTNGDLRAVTSNAVYDAMTTIGGSIDSITGKINGTDVTGTGAMNEGILSFTDVAIINGAVTNGKLAASAVTTDKIADGTITTTDINAANISQVISETSTNSELATGKAVYDAIQTVTMSADACVAPNILVGDPADPNHFICQTVVQ